MAELLTVYEPGDRLLTSDRQGHVREWRVQPDGLLVIVGAARFTEPGWFEVVDDGPRAEQRPRDYQAEQ